uniref:Uncharacterized protein n=1 Tax=Meloidogyne hapla TaxID=6305 RepID=A0A1I8BLY4_MELHA
MLFFLFRCLIQNRRNFSLSSTLCASHAAAITSKQQNKIQESLPLQTNGIVLVPQKLHEHLFGETSANCEQISQMARRKSEEEFLVEEKLKLPQLKSKSLMGHFKVLAEEQFRELVI